MAVDPPFPRLPSLNSLRSFEAAARLGGFAPAAQELQVTAGAVAAQIKALEKDIGAPLFERRAQGVVLTNLGARVLPAFEAAFDSLGDAVAELRRGTGPRKIHIAALPALAQLWLAPRLPALRARFPGIMLSVTALEVPPNLKRVPFDMCLFYEVTPRRGATVLAGDALVPVCTPQLAERMTSPARLLEVPCLTDAVWREDWKTWTSAAFPDQSLTVDGPIYSLYAIAQKEALNGAGVLIARKSLVDPLLTSGELVAPFDTTVTIPEKITAWVHPSSQGTTETRALLASMAELGPVEA